MKEFINKLVGSLDTYNKNSFSARKLSAFVVISCVVAAHIKWLSMGDFTQLQMVLTIDYGFALACLGLTTWQGIKEKQIDKQPTNEQPPI